MWVNIKNLLSLKSLIVLGFAIAVLPLFGGVIYATNGLRETTELGRTINSQVFEQTKTVRLVLQKASDIERKARLFVLLSDPAVRQPYERESYEAARVSFQQTLNDLLELHVDNKVALLANELLEKENLIYQQIISSKSGDSLRVPLDEAFQDFRESSAALSREFESYVEDTFNDIHQLSESLEKELLIKGALLLFFSCAFVLVLLAVLSRAMEQLNLSVRRLGTNKLEDPIKVFGPTDLHYLGERLEWLRKHILALETSKQHLMKNIAREIALPLQGIRSGAERLAQSKEHVMLNPRYNVVDQLENNIVKLKIVSEQLLRYSQARSDQDSKPKSQIEVKTLLESVLNKLEPNIQAKAIKTKYMIKPVLISGIYEQIQEIIEQLLANAIQYSPTKGEIRVILRDVNNFMELEIEDDGPGIAPEERAQVFEPFYRGKSAENHKVGSHLGLGLTTVQEFVNNHHGTVEIIDSSLDYLGTRIRVLIPLN
ncbi:sensor histidine kinase [Methylomonas sp. MgM2]